MGFCTRGSRLVDDEPLSVFSPVAGALCEVRSRPSLSEPLVQPFCSVFVNFRRLGGVSSKCTGLNVFRVGCGDGSALPGVQTGGGGGGGGPPGLRGVLGAGGGVGAPGLHTA